MNYQRLPFSELFADPFFSTLGTRARRSVHRDERPRAAQAITKARGARDLPVTVVRKGDALTVTCEVPGAKMEDLSVSVDGDILEIVAKRSVSHEGRVLHSERQAGEFRRALQLPFEVGGEKVEAHYGKGLLTIELSAQPKKGEKKIQILSGDKE